MWYSWKGIPSYFNNEALEGYSFQFVKCMVFSVSKQPQNKMQESYRVIRIEWDIKGYHIFRIKPHQELELKVTHDSNNRFDEHAMKICCPDVQDIPLQLLTAEAFRQRRDSCLVRDIAGKFVNLCCNSLASKKNH